MYWFSSSDLKERKEGKGGGGGFTWDRDKKQGPQFQGNIPCPTCSQLNTSLHGVGEGGKKGILSVYMHGKLYLDFRSDQT